MAIRVLHSFQRKQRILEPEAAQVIIGRRKKDILLGLFLLAFGSFAFPLFRASTGPLARAAGEPYDIVIRNGHVVDGTG